MKIQNDINENEWIEHIGDESLKPTPLLFSKRFLIVILILIGCINMHSLRGNMSIAVVEMTSNKSITVENQIINKLPEYDWDSQTLGIAISTFSYGYMGSVIGGSIATQFGGVVTYGVAMLLAGFLTSLTPVSLYTHFYLFLATRAVTGLLDSFAYTSIPDIMTRWTPLRERSTLMAYSFSGIYIGNAIVYPSCGYIAHKWGWPMVFYVTGSFCSISAIIWILLVKNQPSKDKWISKRELNYLLSETEQISRKKIVQPWKSIITSQCFWALSFSKFVYSLAYSILVSCFPLYVKDVTGKQTDEVGLIAGIPQICCIFIIPIAGKFIDYCINHLKMNPTKIHKIIMAVGFLLNSFFFLLVSCVSNFTICMLCFVAIKMLLAFNFLVIQLICICLAPKYSGTVAGLTATWSTIGSISTPTLIGYIVVNHSVEEWNKCFIITSIVLAIGALVFIAFGSSEPQPWAELQDDELNGNKEEKCIQK